MIQCFGIKLPKSRDRSVRIGKRLEIGQTKPFVPPSGRMESDSLVDLPRQALPGRTVGRVNALLSQNVHPPIRSFRPGWDSSSRHPPRSYAPGRRNVAGNTPRSCARVGRRPKNRPGFPFGTLQAPVRRIVGILRRIRHVGEEGKARQSLDFRHTPHVASFRFVFFCIA